MSLDNNSYEDSFTKYEEEFIDNSKMFSRWYKFSGRIGRLEFGLTIIVGILIYAFSLGFLLILGFILISILPLF